MRKMSMLVLLACFIGMAFGAAGTQKVVRPNGGNGWAAGMTKQIRYSHSLKSTVKIVLLKGGVPHITIADTVQRNATTTTGYSIYNWSIPSSLGEASDYRVKIIDLTATTPAPSDSSDNDFRIIRNPYITITAPNGGENLTTGTVKAINWTTNLKNSSDSVRIVLLKNGVAVDTLAKVEGDTDGNCTFNWTIPLTTTAGIDYKIKIQDLETDFESISDQSDDFFAIGPVAPQEYVITNPSASGITWLKKTGTALTKSINWTYRTSTDSVRIEYVKGTTVTYIDTALGTAGSYNWNIAALAAGNDYQIRITSKVTSANTDTSNFRFAVYDSLYLDSTALYSTRYAFDNRKEWFTNDSNYVIKWVNGNTNIPTATMIKINLLKGGDLYSTLATVQVGTTGGGNTKYEWRVPANLPAGTNYAIEIVGVDNPIFRDVSKVFTVRKRAIDVTAPAAGALLLTGIPTIVTFNTTTSAGAATKGVHLKLLKGGVAITNVNAGFVSATLDSVTNSTPGTQTFVWTPKTSLVSGNDYKLIAYSISTPNSAAPDTSAAFSISGAKTISSVVPGTLVTWKRGETQNITWDQNFSNEPVVVALFRNNAQVGAPLTVKTSTAGPITYAWTIPSDLATGATYKVKVWNQNFPTVRDSSAVNFKIAEADLRITSPDVSGITWLKGSKYDITWVSGIAENVKIEYVKNDVGGSYRTIAAAAVNNNNGANDTIPDSYKGKYSWTIPDSLLSGNYFIKISGEVTTATNDVSNNPFAISVAPSVSVLHPIITTAADTVLYKGNEFEIEWGKAGGFNKKVKIDLLIEKTPATVPKTYQHHSWISQSATGSAYTWKIPTTLVTSPTTGTGVTAKIYRNYAIRVQSYGMDSAAVRDTSALFKVLVNPIVVTKPNAFGKYGTWTLDSIVTVNFNLTANATLTDSLTFSLVKSNPPGSTDITPYRYSSATGSAHTTAVTAMRKVTPVGARVATFKLPTSLLAGADYKLKITCASSAWDQSDSSFTVQYAWKKSDIANGFIKDFKLEQNYPNPFNNTTSINYSVPTGYNDNVRVSIYNIKGEIVHSLVNRVHTSGIYSVSFNAASLVSGVYYYEIVGNDFKDIKRMLLLK